MSLRANTPSQFRTVMFEEAALNWLEIKKRQQRKPRTIEMYQWYIRNLSRKFAGILLSQIQIKHIQEYQQRRKLSAGPSCVNHEINTLAQILRQADLWRVMEKQYCPLPLPDWTPPKVLTAEEEERFFRVAAGNPDWSVAYWAVSLTNNTSAKGTELRQLQIKHLKLAQETPTIHIPDDAVKNELGARVVPLNDVAEKQIRRILKRAHALGARSPEHYVFPYRIKKNIYDVTRPASPNFLRTAFRSMRRATGMDWLQPRNFRHQVIARLFEKGTPEETIISIAGPQSIKMSRYYSLIKISAKAEALRAICPGNSA
jgi:integrase